MRHVSMKWIATAAAAVLFAGLPLVSLTPARAQDAAATSQPAGKATITVTVVDSDQKPVAKARVRLMTAKPADGGKATAVANERTGDDGTAKLTGIADGDYVVMANLKASGAGREKVTISNGADATVSITLKARKARGGGGGAPATQPS